MYLHKHYNVRAVPRYQPVFNEVQYLDQQIDAITRDKHLARQRFSRQLDKAHEGFSRILKQSEQLNNKIFSDKINRETDETNFKKDLQMTADTMGKVNESNWRESRVRKQVQEIREFNADVKLRDRLVENNIKAFDRLQIIRDRK